MRETRYAGGGQAKASTAGVSLRQAFLDWVRDGTPADADPATGVRVLIQHVVWAVLTSLGSCYIAVFALTGVYAASLIIGLLLAIGTTALLRFTRRGRPRQGGRWLALILYVDICAAMVGRGGIEGNAAAATSQAPGPLGEVPCSTRNVSQVASLWKFTCFRGACARINMCSLFVLPLDAR